MNDNGQTNLNKRQYDYPGYTKVPKKGERHLCKLDPERSFDCDYTDLEPAKDSVEKFVDTEVFQSISLRAVADCGNKEAVQDEDHPKKVCCVKHQHLWEVDEGGNENSTMDGTMVGRNKLGL